MTGIQKSTSPSLDIELPLVSLRRERAQQIQKLQHAIPAVPLLIVGVQGLMAGDRGFALALALAELVVSLLLLFTLVKNLIPKPRPAHTSHSHGVDWFDIFAAGILTVEALEHWHTHHHPPRPMLVTAAVTLGLGLFHGRIAAYNSRRRSLRINTEGIRLGGRFFRQHFVAWPNIERIDIGDRKAQIVAHNGRKLRINLGDLRNASEVRQALLAARARLAALQPPQTSNTFKISSP